MQTGEGDFQPDFFSAKAAAVEPITREERKGPGRPKGALNKTTAEVLSLIQHTKGDPRIALARIMATPIADLAVQLGMKNAEAAEFWLRCTLGLAGCFPKAVEVAVKSESTKLVLFAGSPQAPVELGQGGVVGLLEQAARQAREEGWDSPLPAPIEGEAEEVPQQAETKA